MPGCSAPAISDTWRQPVAPRDVASSRSAAGYEFGASLGLSCRTEGVSHSDAFCPNRMASLDGGIGLTTTGAAPRRPAPASPLLALASHCPAVTAGKNTCFLEVHVTTTSAFSFRAHSVTCAFAGSGCGPHCLGIFCNVSPPGRLRDTTPNDLSTVCAERSETRRFSAVPRNQSARWMVPLGLQLRPALALLGVTSPGSDRIGRPLFLLLVVNLGHWCWRHSRRRQPPDNLHILQLSRDHGLALLLVVRVRHRDNVPALRLAGWPLA